MTGPYNCSFWGENKQIKSRFQQDTTKQRKPKAAERSKLIKKQAKKYI